MDNDHYDIIVIGSGPGGEGAAMQATKAGKRVALIEKYERIGGGCTHWGTIPSKALRHQVAELQAFNSNPLLVGRGKIKLSVSQFMRAANSVIDRQVTMREGFYFRNDVPVFHGHARFTGKNAIEVLGSEPGHPTENLTADSFVIATGSRPYRPANVDFDHPRIFDSDKILSLDQDLHSMTIYGAGVIGCEYASIFRGM
ncbi:MAG: FAD-dependent oxidoreductase, partial [Phycisphaerae bacterium]|nr:FAD-dependent oxidoreductase [Phycisphaerae bacterium]